MLHLNCGCSFFLLNAVADLMVHFRVPGLPSQLDYVSAILALSVEGFLFRWHQGGNFKGFTNISSVNDMKNWLNVLIKEVTFKIRNNELTAIIPKKIIKNSY